MSGSNKPNKIAEPHAPVQERSYRCPSPPRIIVPPPELNARGVPEIPLVGHDSYDFESSGFANFEFLNIVTHANMAKHNVVLDWKYEERRKAQQVLPYLYLGPSSAAKDQVFLKKEGITMVLAVRNTKSAQAKLLGSRVADELGLESQSIDVKGNQELIAAFPRGIEVINAHLSKMYRQQRSRIDQAVVDTGRQAPDLPGKVLLYCESGNDRSACLVVAYIMAMYSQDLITAIQTVQAHRFAVAFDDALRQLLSTYETILQAKREVMQADISMAGPQTVSGDAVGRGGTARNNQMKRTINELYEDDEDVDMDSGNGEMDVERFEKREGLAPFEDRWA